MGLTAIISSATASLSLLSPVGMSVGGSFVVVALVALLAYLDVFDALERSDRQVKTMLYATVVPLAVTFGGIVAFQVAQTL